MNFPRIILTTIVYSSVGVNNVNCQNCTLETNCLWITHSGFRYVPIDELAKIYCSENDTCSTINGGNVFAIEFKSNGSLESPWILSSAFPTGLCLSFDVFPFHRKELYDQIKITLILQHGDEKNITWISPQVGRSGKVVEHITAFVNRIKLRILIAGKDNRDGIIVVDNIILSDECPKAQIQSVFKCTFEVDQCGWQNVYVRDKNELVWTKHRGPSPTLNTGPEVDHTIGTDKGYYMYVETSGGNMFQAAILNSVVLPALKGHVQQEEKCVLRFFYHMRGRNVGDLQVKMVDLCGPNKKPVLLWSVSGNQGDEWHLGEARIRNTTSRYILQFQGSGALLGHGDIAIDDVSFSPECFGIENNLTHYYNTSSILDAITIQEFRNNSEVHCKGILGTSTVAYLKHMDVGRSLFIDVGYLVAIIICLVVMFFVICGVLTYKALCKNMENTAQTACPVQSATASIQASTVDMQLRCTVTEFNPNYDLIAAKFPEHNLREIPRNKLKLIRLLGQGAFGEVYEGQLKNLCENVVELPVAVKTLPALCTEQAETDFLMEAIIISKFMHKNVVKCLGVCFDDVPKYIVLELLEGGVLKTFLRDSRPTPVQPCSVTMEDLVKLSLDIAHGCRHLEEKHFVHRDIACRNCLLTSCGPGRIAKIADFGMSRDIYSADYYKKGGKAMLPIKWMPPEAFLDGIFTSKTDVWSYGVLLWEMLTLGYMPYPGQTNSDVMHLVASGGRLDPPQNCPTRLNKIMIMCWNSVADIRPSFSEIIELLEMCLQDQEVMDVDPTLCHMPIAEFFKDASTLARVASYTPEKVDNEDQTEDMAAGFHCVEAQSREPLLLTSDEN